MGAGNADVTFAFWDPDGPATAGTAEERVLFSLAEAVPLQAQPVEYRCFPPKVFDVFFPSAGKIPGKDPAVAPNQQSHGTDRENGLQFSGTENGDDQTADRGEREEFSQLVRPVSVSGELKTRRPA